MIKQVEDYTLTEKIGEGNFGEVYRAVNARKAGEFAVKSIPKEKYHENAELEECTMNEISTLSAMDPCEHIVHYEGHFQSANNYYFVYEYCNGGTLEEMIRVEGRLPEPIALAIFRQLLEAFKVLNRFNIMHRDIKPENIFLSDGKVKLGDFGFCKELKPGEHTLRTMIGSPIYMAPEVLRGEIYTTKADVWSLGVVLYEMLFGVAPYEAGSIASLAELIKSREPAMPVERNPISKKTQSLLRKMLARDYIRRISWIELFGVKIDEDGNYIERTSSQEKDRKNYMGSARSISLYGEEKGKEGSPAHLYQTSTKIDIGPAPRESGIKFYSSKYVDLLSKSVDYHEQKSSKSMENGSLPSQTPASRASQKGADSPANYEAFTDSKFHIPVIPDPFKEEDQVVVTDDPAPSKKEALIRQHGESMRRLEEGLRQFEERGEEGLADCLELLRAIHASVKESAATISYNETDLLGIASSLNYELILLDRQIIDTKQELARRNGEAAPPAPPAPTESRGGLGPAKTF